MSSKKESVKTLIKLYDRSVEKLNKDIEKDGASSKEIEFQNSYFKEIKNDYLKLVYSKKIKTIDNLADFILNAQKIMVDAIKSK